MKAEDVPQDSNSSADVQPPAGANQRLKHCYKSFPIGEYSTLPNLSSSEIQKMLSGLETFKT